jgi:hypothetical protein
MAPRPGWTVLLAVLAVAALARALGLPGLVAASVALLAMLAAYAAACAFRARPRRSADGGFRYVYVEEGGGARELAADERAYLEAELHPADGGRPYVKSRYASRTPDGRLAGYLPRRKLPCGIEIRPAPPEPASPGVSAR